jgi:hypothetical protein
MFKVKCIDRHQDWRSIVEVPTYKHKHKHTHTNIPLNIRTPSYCTPLTLPHSVAIVDVSGFAVVWMLLRTEPQSWTGLRDGEGARGRSSLSVCVPEGGGNGEYGDCVETGARR